jgi:hypothetical protein
LLPLLLPPLLPLLLRDHAGEVLTWRDCRFHNGGNRPGLLITWRLDAPPWSVVPMHGRNFTHGTETCFCAIDAKNDVFTKTGSGQT